MFCDYTLYLWHILLHRWPFLRRFHLAHHVDLDLTATTVVRFHFGESLLSVPWRAAQVLLIGVSLAALRLWQTAALVEILFHHSNLRLPRAIERALCRILVTARLDVPQQRITIGIPARRQTRWCRRSPGPRSLSS